MPIGQVTPQIYRKMSSCRRALFVDKSSNPVVNSTQKINDCVLNMYGHCFASSICKFSHEKVDSIGTTSPDSTGNSYPLLDREIKQEEPEYDSLTETNEVSYYSTNEGIKQEEPDYDSSDDSVFTYGSETISPHREVFAEEPQLPAETGNSVIDFLSFMNTYKIATANYSLFPDGIDNLEGRIPVYSYKNSFALRKFRKRRMPDSTQELTPPPEECVLNKYGHYVSSSVCPFSHGESSNKKMRLCDVQQVSDDVSSTSYEATEEQSCEISSTQFLTPPQAMEQKECILYKYGHCFAPSCPFLHGAVTSDK